MVQATIRKAQKPTNPIVVETPEIEEVAQELKEEVAEKEVVKSKNRPKRVSMREQAKNVLTWNGKQEDGYHYRFVNDIDDRVERAKLAGYEFVEDTKSIVGDRHADSPTNIGTVVTKKVGRGVTAYLMRTLQEYYVEDQSAKQTEVDQTEETMRQGQYYDSDGPRTGSLTINRANRVRR